MELDKNTRKGEASSSKTAPASLEYSTDKCREPSLSLRNPPVGRELKRSNTIAFIPSQAEKGTQDETLQHAEDNHEPELAEPGVDWEMIDKSPIAKKKSTKPKTRELIKAAGEHTVSEHDLEDKMVSVTLL